MKQHSMRILGVALFAALIATAAFAGGPLFTYDYENRIPYTWNMTSWPGGAVPVYTDLGNLKNSGPLISNARANQITADAVAQWNAVPSSSFNGAVVGDFSLLGLGDIDQASAMQILGAWNGGGIQVIYDTDGNILRNILGVSPTSVFGITNIDFTASDRPEILEAWVVLSGPGVRSNDPDGVGFSGVFTHELGHALNLAHTTTNGQVLANNDQPKPRDCAAPWSGNPTASQTETMFPLINPTPTGSGAAMFTVDRIDDIAALSNLYPAAGWPQSHGTIRGTISARHRVQGGAQNNEYEVGSVNVIARRIGDPFNDANSYLSGQISKGHTGPDGSFELNGLTPGADYLLYVDNLLSGAYSVPRIVVLPGPEEYYNGINESGDGLTDDRCAYTPIRVAAGSPVTANIVFNRVKGAPEFLPQPAVGIPTGITPDGSTVVGAVTAGTAYKWTLADNVYQSIGGAGADQVSISDDGAKIAASARTESGVIAPAIYENGLWTILPLRADAVAPCGTGTRASWGSAFDISGDGSTVVGLSYRNGCSSNVRGFVSKGGVTGTLPKSPDYPANANRANAVSYDGSRVVGWDSGSWNRGTFWDVAADGTIGPANVLEVMYPAMYVGEALNLTRDGSQIVGLGANTRPPTGDDTAWRYSASEGVVMFPNMPDAWQGAANSISDDGRVVAGFSEIFSRVPALWTAELGWFGLVPFMNAQGTYAQDMVIANPTGMTGDGDAIIGWGNTVFGQVGWVLKTPKAVMCHVSGGHGGATKTIDVSFPGGLNDHLAHGDTLGLCQHGGE